MMRSMSVVAMALVAGCLGAQGFGHRLPSAEFAIPASENVFHARFVGDGVAPAVITVLEYVPSTGGDQEVDEVALPGAIPGLPFPIGNGEWLVGSVTTGATPSARAGWLSRVQLTVSGGVCTGVQVAESVSIGSHDAFRLSFDGSRILMLDPSNGVVAMAPYTTSGALPSAATWTTLGAVGDWPNRRAFNSAVALEMSATSVSMWSPFDASANHVYSLSAGVWGHQTSSRTEGCCKFAGFPGVNTMSSWSFESTPGESWQLRDQALSVLDSGIVPASGNVTVSATAVAKGLEGTVARLDVGTRRLGVPVRGALGRVVGSSGVELGQLLSRPAVRGEWVYAVGAMELQASPDEAYLFVGWRDDATGSDPISWTGDIAVVDVSLAAALALPISVDSAGLLGDYCPRVLQVPADDNLAGVCLTLQIAVRFGATWSVSDIAVAPIRGQASPSLAQRSSASASWRSSIAPQAGSPDIQAILLSLQGR